MLYLCIIIIIRIRHIIMSYKVEVQPLCCPYYICSLMFFVLLQIYISIVM